MTEALAFRAHRRRRRPSLLSPERRYKSQSIPFLHTIFHYFSFFVFRSDVEQSFGSNFLLGMENERHAKNVRLESSTKQK